MFEFWAGVKFVTLVTTNLGGLELAGIFSPASLLGSSPSCLNASSRIASIRSVSELRLATVKSHARYRLRRAIPARLSVAKIDSMCAALFVSPPGYGASELHAVHRLSRNAANTAGAWIGAPCAVFRSRSATM